MTSVRTALLGVDPWLEDDATFRPFNYGVHRVHAAVVERSHAGDAALFEARPGEDELLFERVMAFEPDVVGLSAYVWSLPTLLSVARRLKAERSRCAVILGGPSARANLLALEPYRDVPSVVDAVAPGEGEAVMRAVVAAGPNALDRVRGLWLHDGAAWRPNGAGVAEEIALEALPSPYRLGTAPRGVTAHLERFKGCPLSCAFCQWGVMGAPDRVLGVDALCREFEAHRAAGARGMMIVDAGLNLHARAFDNLAEAARRTGALDGVPLHCELYPNTARDPHLEFLARADAHVGIGLQSYDPGVLALMDRRADVATFERFVSDVSDVAEPTVEVILGLPGSHPESFRRSFERARELPCALRVYQCLVLPEGLMARGRPEFSLDFDPITLELRACQGWSRDALTAERERLTELATAEGGFAAYSWWHFRPPADRGSARRGPPGGLDGPGSRARVPDVRTSADGHAGDAAPVIGDLYALLAECVERATGGWSLASACVIAGTLRLECSIGDAQLTLELWESAAAGDGAAGSDALASGSPERAFFAEHAGIRSSHRGDSALSAATRAALDAFLRVSPRAVRIVLEASRRPSV